MVILDFSKAFDCVPHQRLLRKLHHYDIRGNTHQWISSFLLGRSQRVVVEGCTSDSVPVVSGVPQGSVLGVLALPVVHKRHARQYQFQDFADDCIVYRPTCTRDQEDGAALEQDLYMP